MFLLRHFSALKNFKNLRHDGWKRQLSISTMRHKYSLYVVFQCITFFEIVINLVDTS